MGRLRRLVVVFTCLHLSWSAHGQTASKVILWNTLAGYNLTKKLPSRELASVDNQLVRIPGYMVPLEVSGDKTSEFLLMPSLAACIHVAPPPPNQTVHVTLPPHKGIKMTWEPVWVEGTLKIVSGSPDAAFELAAVRTAKFNKDDVASTLPEPKNAPVYDCQGRDKNEGVCARKLPK